MLGKAHEYFARAERGYDQAVHMIRSLDEAFQSSAFERSPEQRYDTRITLMQFDVILQAILLTMALTDGSFHRLERRMIDKLARYGDLMVYLGREGEPFFGLDWEDVGGLSDQQRTALLEELPRVLERTCDSFVLPLALVDGAVDSVDFLERLEAQLREIALSLSAVDGKDEPEELAAFGDMLEHLLTRRWQTVKADAQREKENGTD